MTLKRKNSFVAVFAAVGLVSGLMTGCGSDQEEAAPAASSPSPGQTAQAANVYPLQDSGTLTYWGPVGNSNMTNFFPNVGETPFGKELEARTGVKVKYTHPAAGQQKEQFNLMIASNELPDIVETNWFNGGDYPGGPDKALKDKLILPLNDLIDKHAPNLKKLLEQNKELKKMLQTDSGEIFVFPMIRNPVSQVYTGPMVRKDWLDELGLAVPTTIDEWETMLKAFKEKKGAAAPFSAYSVSTGEMNIGSTFIGAYRTSDGFYLDDNGQVKYGPAQPQFKDALTLFNRWYKDGLIDKDFALTDTKTLTSKIVSGQAGATVNLLSGGLQTYLDAMAGKDPKFNMVGTPYPTLKKGETPFVGQYDFPIVPGRGAAITADAKNPELAVKWLDYAYSTEGSRLFNFGIEGVSYELKNGKPAFTDKITKDPAYSMVQMLSQYVRYNGPFAIDEEFTKAVMKYPQQEEAVKLWSATDAPKHALPPFITPTEDEARELAKIFTAITSYKSEMVLKFIIGKEPLDSFDAYVKQMEQLGLSKVLNIYQGALERYNAR
ncbi:MAG: extracellular solute-binding protein [Paenibacillaceae bacterium]|jgi:putative aldouronate transport system substrate-binding protein|nr:extracellular solute-binding protein [Paenibacillaceae bacterium]